MYSAGDDLFSHAPPASSLKSLQGGASGPCLCGDAEGSGVENVAAFGLSLRDDCHCGTLRIMHVLPGTQPRPKTTVTVNMNDIILHLTPLPPCTSLHVQEAEDAERGVLTNMPAAFYWAIQTITTVGMTKYPGTPMGQVVSVFVSVLGVLFLAVPAGIVASGFTEMIEEDRRTRAIAKQFKLRTNASRNNRQQERERATASRESELQQRAAEETGAAAALAAAAARGAATAPAPSAHVAMADASVEVQQQAVGSSSGGTAAWAARIEDRQERMEASLERLEGMLSSLLVSVQDDGSAGHEFPSPFPSPSPSPSAPGGGRSRARGGEGGGGSSGRDGLGVDDDDGGESGGAASFRGAE